MNLVVIKQAAEYPALNGDAGHYEIKASNGMTIHYAYFVVGRGGGMVAVFEGSGSSKMAAIDHLQRQMSCMRDYTDVVWHGAFWPIMKAAEDQRAASVRQALGIADAHEIETPKKDEGLS